MKLQYAIIETLEGNYKLKQLQKAEKALDNIEYELYGDTMQEIERDYRQHIKELKLEGFI